jgi:hypothetical protein
MLCGSFVNTTCLEWCARTSVDLRTFTRAYPLVHLELHVRCDDDLVFRRPRQVVAQFVLLKIVRIDDHSGHAWFPAARGRAYSGRQPKGNGDRYRLRAQLFTRVESSADLHGSNGVSSGRIDAPSVLVKYIKVPVPHLARRRVRPLL